MYYITNPNNIILFFIEMFIYMLIYAFIMWKLGMNNYEKKLFSNVVMQIANKIKKNRVKET